MAQTLQIKRSTTTASPTALANGELAYSADSSKLFIGRPGGGTGDIDAVGGKYYTDIIAGATSANTASKLVLRDGSGNFSAGTITATISGNVTGALTGNASTATILQTARTIGGVSFNGSAPINLPGVNTAGNQNTSGNAGTATAFSDARTSIPVITVNAKGLVTAVTTASIATSFNIAADSGTTNALDGGETLTISGGTGVSSVVSANEITLNIGQAVATTSNVTFNNVVVDGTLSTDDIQASTLTASGDVIVEGDLTVNGTTTTVNSNTVNIGDAMITLNSDEAGTPSQDAGLEVERGTSTNTKIYWDESAKYWVLGDGDTPSYARILTAASWGSAYTGAVDGGTF